MATIPTSAPALARANSRVLYVYSAGLLCLLVPLFLVTVYTLNHFYSTGAVFWDAGLYSYLASFSDQWPMLYPEFLHRDPGTPRVTFFVIHFMPIFFLTTAVHQLVPFIPAAAYFSSLLQGLWSGLTGLSVFMLCVRRQHLVLAASAALTTALCGPVLAGVGFPHPEVAVPALLLLFFALRSTGSHVGSWVALALCLSVREDAGFHAAGPLFLLAAAQWVSGASKSVARDNALIALACVTYALAAMALQYFGFPSEVSQLERIYLGRPFGAHLSWPLILDRGAEFLVGRAYATWPLIILLCVALWTRSAVLLAGAIAAIPWVVVSLLAVRDQSLWTYYSFPLIIVIAWPSIAHGVNGARLQLVLSAVSIGLFVVCGGDNLDKSPWRSLKMPELGAVGTYESVLRNTVSRRGEFGRLMVDDAVVSLIPEAVALNEWVLQWEVDRLPNPDVVIYLPDARFRAETDKAINASGLVHRCALPGTPFVMASRVATGYCR